jgi:hypothetical protein
VGRLHRAVWDRGGNRGPRSVIATIERGLDYRQAVAQTAHRGRPLRSVFVRLSRSPKSNAGEYYVGRIASTLFATKARYLSNSAMLRDLKRDTERCGTLYIQRDSPGAEKESRGRARYMAVPGTTCSLSDR